MPPSANLQSRGHLVTDFLDSDLPPAAFLETIDSDSYGGFNLLVADDVSAAYLSNRGGGLRELSPGIYGVANATLDEPWNKTVRSKSALDELISEDRVNETRLLEILADRRMARVADVEPDHLPFARARAMTAPFIVQPDYGTRCSTVVIRDADNRLRFSEVRFRADGSTSGRSDFAFRVGSQDS